jgi:hypothetical protein
MAPSPSQGHHCHHFGSLHRRGADLALYATRALLWGLPEVRRRRIGLLPLKGTVFSTIDRAHENSGSCGQRCGVPPPSPGICSLAAQFFRSHGTSDWEPSLPFPVTSLPSALSGLHVIGRPCSPAARSRAASRALRPRASAVLRAVGRAGGGYQRRPPPRRIQPKGRHSRLPAPGRADAAESSPAS